MKRQDNGFVLVNALVLVAALSALVILLLGRAELGRQSLQAGQNTQSMDMALDSAEALALHLLYRDRQSAEGWDHPAEAWAQPWRDLPLDGIDSPFATAKPGPLSGWHLTGGLRDEQALFNLNWLTRPAEDPLQIAFDRLLERQGIASTAATAIRAYLQPGGPSERSVYQQPPLPRDPVGGALFSLAQLDEITALSDRDRARLRPLVTVLPGDSQINVNTVGPDLLAALLPDVPPAQQASILANRSRQPFTSVETFLNTLGLNEEAATTAGLSPDRLSIESQWMSLTARLTRSNTTTESTADPARSATRQALIWRAPAPLAPEIKWRRSRFD